MVSSGRTPDPHHISGVSEIANVKPIQVGLLLDVEVQHYRNRPSFLRIGLLDFIRPQPVGVARPRRPGRIMSQLSMEEGLSRTLEDAHTLNTNAM